MKRFIRALLPYLTAVLILVGGSGITLAVRSFLPDHTDIITNTDTENKTAYYIESDRSIYPWDILTEDDKSLTHWLNENHTESTMIIGDIVNHAISTFAEDFAPAENVVKTEDEFRIHIEDNDIYLYAKDITYTSVNGEKCTASIVWKNDTIICIDLDKTESGTFSSNTDSSAVVSAYLTYLRKSSEYTIYESEASKEMEESNVIEDMLHSNPIRNAMVNIMSLYTEDNEHRDYPVYNLIMYGSYYTVNLDGKLLLVLNGDAGTLILHYDPESASVTGFTFNGKS